MQLEFDLQRNLHTFQDLSEPHWHAKLEILICFSDGGHFMLGNDMLPLCRGMVFIIEKGILHRCVVDVASYDRYILHVSYETLWMLSSPQTDILSILQHAGGYVIFNDQQLNEISVLMEQCLTAKDTLASDLEQNIVLMQIILYIVRQINNKQSGLTPTVSKSFQKIMPVLNYIRDHYSEDITLECLSEIIFVSKFHLCRIFKETTGFSVGRYITNYRIRQACQLLRKGRSIQDAGEEVGFCNNANFIRTFRIVMGTPPGKYAKHYRYQKTSSDIVGQQR